jgi:WD40 repeat protein
VVVFQPTEIRFARWAFAWGGWLFILAGSGGLTLIAIAASTEYEAGSTDLEQPFAQVSRQDYQAPIWSLAYSADGGYLAAATLTGDVWLDERAIGRVARLEHRSWISVQSLAFAPVQHVLAVAGDHPAVRLCDVVTGRELATLGVDSGFAKSVAFSTDGVMLAVGERRGPGEGGVVALWDWRKPRRLAVLEGHRGVINVLAFSGDGSQLASGDSQGFVRVWDVATRRERMTLRAQGNGRIIQSLTFSPDGTLLVTAGHLDGDVRLWDAASGAPRGMLPTTRTGVNAMAFAPNGVTLAMAGGDGAISLWDLAGRREVGILRTPGATLQSLAFSPDGRHLATGGADGAVRHWDMAQALGGRDCSRNQSTSRAASRSR